jgi:hypothetical protein
VAKGSANVAELEAKARKWKWNDAGSVVKAKAATGNSMRR